MLNGWLAPRRRAAALVLLTLLCAVGLVGWAYLLARLYAEAPIVAFGRVAPQLERLTALLAAYLAAGALLLLLTIRLGWLAGREIVRGRRKREAERLLEN
ncbi:MAG: hypothetical protein QME79_07890 [Bacillota bacterium]|nr:hypothetical protein [Bacillota bacterium]